SISTVSHWKPLRAMKRAAGMLPSDSQVPTEGCPNLRARLTEFGRIIESLSMGRVGVGQSSGRGRRGGGTRRAGLRPGIAGRLGIGRIIFHGAPAGQGPREGVHPHGGADPIIRAPIPRMATGARSALGSSPAG